MAESKTEEKTEGVLTNTKSTANDEKTWAIISHLSALIGFVFPFGNILGPLFIMITKGEESKFVKDNARESLNFQITTTIYYIIGFILMLVLIGFLAILAVLIFEIIQIIKAVQAAQRKEVYSYPFNIRFIK